MNYITTTLSRIKACNPSKNGWEKLLAGLNKSKADDEPLPFASILHINGLNDALWCLRAEPQHGKLWRLMAVRFAREVQHFMLDQRSLDALDVAERYANGEATKEELNAAMEAANWAAAAKAEKWEAKWAAWAAAKAAMKAAENAAMEVAKWAAKEKQQKIFLEIVGV